VVSPRQQIAFSNSRKLHAAAIPTLLSHLRTWTPTTTARPLRVTLRNALRTRSI
jgi:hypothetical protein